MTPKPETPMRRWRQKLGLTQDQAAAALGVSRRTITDRDALTDLPREVQLAMLALDIGRPLLDPSLPIPLSAT